MAGKEGFTVMVTFVLTKNEVLCGGETDDMMRYEGRLRTLSGVIMRHPGSEWVLRNRARRPGHLELCTTTPPHRRQAAPRDRYHLPVDGGSVVSVVGGQSGISWPLCLFCSIQLSPFWPDLSLHG